jgi:hypothetical protein
LFEFLKLFFIPPGDTRAYFTGGNAFAVSVYRFAWLPPASPSRPIARSIRGLAGTWQHFRPILHSSPCDGDSGFTQKAALCLNGQWPLVAPFAAWVADTAASGTALCSVNVVLKVQTPE